MKSKLTVDILLLFLFKGFPYSIFEFVEGSITQKKYTKNNYNKKQPPPLQKNPEEKTTTLKLCMDDTGFVAKR